MTAETGLNRIFFALGGSARYQDPPKTMGGLEVPVQLSELRNYEDEKGNKIKVGQNVKFTSSTLLIKDRGAIIEIGNNVTLPRNQIEVGHNSKLVISDGCTISGKITVGYNSRIEIGSGLSVTGNLTIRAVESTSIEIGDDCLFGSDIIIRTADGHPVYDAYSRERINHSKSISIGHHVWIADRVVVLKGADIGNASAVGVGSVLTKSIGCNCVAVGNPARIVRTGVMWERSPGIRTEEYYLDDERARAET
jgi:acetyltransferase-like isoleucine patch superfamily enzyme